jgi:hypothetical protein
VERCLYPSRRRVGLLVFGCFLLIILTATSARNRRSGGAMLSFLCVIGVIMSSVSLVPGAAWLKLDSQGFRVRYWFKDNTYRWTDIKEFKLITYRYMGFIPVRRSVGFTFSESYPKRNVVSRIAGAIASFDRNLPDNYGMKAKDLLVLLESCRRQTVGVDANRYQVPWPAIEPE